MAWLNIITAPINWISSWGSVNRANTPNPDLLIAQNIEVQKPGLSSKLKQTIHLPVDLKSVHTPTWNESITTTLNTLTNSLMTLGAPLLNSLPGWNSFMLSKIKNLLLVNPKVEPFNPQGIKAKCSIREITAQQSSQVIGKKYFLEPNIPFEQQKQIVVLVHGARTTGNIFENAVEDLLSQGHSVLIGDMVGFGANKNIELTNQNLIRDVVGMIREASILREGEHISIIGHSLGTAIIVAALKEIFKEGLNLPKIDKIVLISAWDKLAKVAEDLLVQDSNNKGQTKLQKIIDREIGHHDEGLEKVLRQKLNDPANSIESVLGQEFNTFDNLKELLELNAVNNSRIQEFKFIHGRQDEFVGYERSIELDQLAKSMQVNSSHILDEQGTHFDNRINGKSSLPSKLIMDSLANPVRRNVISEDTAQLLLKRVNRLSTNDLLAQLHEGKIPSSQYEALINFLKSQLAGQKYSLIA